MTKGEVVAEDVLHVVDVRVDLLQTVSDFLVRVILAVKGVQFHFGFADILNRCEGLANRTARLGRRNS